MQSANEVYVHTCTYIFYVHVCMYIHTYICMRETSILDNLNCKMQPHAMVCKENKLELKEK